MKHARLIPLLLLAACGGKRGTISLSFVHSSLIDPFGMDNSAVNARFIIGTVTKEVAITNGTLTFELDEKPPKTTDNLVVEVLEADDTTVVGYGRTPPIDLSANGQNDTYGVWVGKPGTIFPGNDPLPEPRTELAGAAPVGLGGIFVGGRGLDGVPVADGAIYSVFTSTIVTSSDATIPVPADLTTARAGAVGVATTAAPDMVVFGGATATGPDAPGGPLATAELFDPSEGNGPGAWSPVPTSAAAVPVATSHPDLTLLGSGQALVTGGQSNDGTPNNSATLLATGSTIVLTPLPNGMTTARYRHAAAAAQFPAGDGALIIGGLPDTGTPGPIVEQLVGQSFATLDEPGVENRWDATATALPGGVLLVGGTILDPTTMLRKATNSVVYIPTDPMGTPIVLTTLGNAPRAGHTATLVGTDVLLCGGYDDMNNLLATCDVLATNGSVVSLKRTVTGALPRKNHVAVQLETGMVLIAGGEDQMGTPLAGIDIYTPDADEMAAIVTAQAAAAATTTTTQ